MRTRNGLITNLLIAFVMICIVFMTLSTQMRLDKLKAEKAEREEQVEEYSDKVEELEYELERPIDDEVIKRIAREKLGYYVLGDTVYYYNDGE